MKLLTYSEADPDHNMAGRGGFLNGSHDIEKLRIILNFSIKFSIPRNHPIKPKDKMKLCLFEFLNKKLLQPVIYITM